MNRLRSPRGSIGEQMKMRARTWCGMTATVLDASAILPTRNSAGNRWPSWIMGAIISARSILMQRWISWCSSSRGNRRQGCFWFFRWPSGTSHAPVTASALLPDTNGHLDCRFGDRASPAIAKNWESCCQITRGNRCSVAGGKCCWPADPSDRSVQALFCPARLAALLAIWSWKDGTSASDVYPQMHPQFMSHTPQQVLTDFRIKSFKQ